MMHCYQQSLQVDTPGRALVDISDRVRQIVAASGVQIGLCTVFIRHTSASLLIQENADPAVLRDLGRFLATLAPESERWEHADEGPDDMPAHARAAITRTSETIPVSAGDLALGRWQGLYLWEHRTRPHRREIIVHVAGNRE